MSDLLTTKPVRSLSFSGDKLKDPQYSACLPHLAELHGKTFIIDVSKKEHLAETIRYPVILVNGESISSKSKLREKILTSFAGSEALLSTLLRDDQCDLFPDTTSDLITMLRKDSPEAGAIYPSSAIYPYARFISLENLSQGGLQSVRERHIHFIPTVAYDLGMVIEAVYKITAIDRMIDVPVKVEAETEAEKLDGVGENVKIEKIKGAEARVEVEEYRIMSYVDNLEYLKQE